MELVADDQPFEGVEPGDGPFDLPATPVAKELPRVVSRLADAALAVRTDQLDAPLGEALSQRIAVGGPVVDEPRREVWSVTARSRRLVRRGLVATLGQAC